MTAEKNKSKSIEGDINNSGRDALAELMVKEMNKGSKDKGKIAYFLDDKEDPSTIIDWVSTGSTMLDLAISNRPYGGLPVGRCSILEGLEASGKSLICAHIVANTQKKGGQAVYIDTESAAAPEFWSALGVNLRNMAYIQLTTIEDVFRKLESLIAIARKENPNRLVTFIVDSIAGASTEVEMESDYGKQGYGMGKAKTISEAMRKLTNLIAQQRVLVVFTNQLRMNIKAQAFQDPYCVDPFSTKIKIRYKLK